MRYLHVGIWAESQERFEQVMTKYGLLFTDDEGNKSFHRKMQVAGPFVISEKTGKQITVTGPDGEKELVDETKPLPGLHWNVRAFGSLYNALVEPPSHVAVPDVLDEYGNVIKKGRPATEEIDERSDFARSLMGARSSKESRAQIKGVSGNSKLPAGMGMAGFRWFDLAELDTPFNTWV